MSETLEPISPSDAARILSEQRWGGGQESSQPVEEKPAPLTYTEMTPAYPVKRSDETSYDSAEIKERIEAAPAQEPNVVSREYKQQSGPDAGAPSPARETVTLEQGAHDVALARRGEVEAAEMTADLDLQHAIDQLRAGDQQQQQPQPTVETQTQPTEQPQAQEQPQADAQPASDGDEVARALQNPKVLAAVQDYVGQATAQSNAMSQYYAQAVQHNAMAATAALVNQFPELNGLTAEQVPTAIKVVAQSNPERAQAMIRTIEGTRNLLAENQRVQAAQMQAHQYAAQEFFQRAAEDADSKYDAWAAKQGSPAEARAIKEAAFEILRESGLNDQQIAAEWNSNQTLRSFWGQRVLHDAARYRLAQQGAKTKAVKPVPIVQRPGSPAAFELQEETDFRRLNARLDNPASSRDAIKAAAEIVARRRANRR